MTKIVAVAIGLAALLSSPAWAAQGAIPERGAVGLLVLGRGQALREELASERCRCEITIHRLPPPRRYSIRIVGAGLQGLLVSDRTRVPGLVSLSDVEATVRALERGGKPPITSRPNSDPDDEIRELDVRLTQVHQAGRWAYWILAGALVAFALAALALRSPLWGRAALLAPPIAMATAVGLSGLELSRPRTVALVLLAAVALAAPLLAAIARRERVLGMALLAIFVVYAVAFLFSSETVSLAAIGPHPEGGGRFYGFTNLMETLLLVPGLVGAALLGRRSLVPVGLLVLVVVGSSRLGADGGGVLVFAAAFVFLWLRLRRVPITLRTLALVGAGAVAAGLLLVGLDAALGGASHVTRALGDGPGAVAGEIAHRWNVSAHGLVSSANAVVLISCGAAVVVWVGLRRPRYAILDAVLVALAVSLLVNDSPRDVVTWGALSCLALRLWEDARRVQ
ncbi:MAG: hypothetical protein AABM30_07100 [Actinomycetota bacterium]